MVIEGFMLKYLDTKTNKVIKVHPWSKRVKLLEKDKRYAKYYEE